MSRDIVKGGGVLAGMSQGIVNGVRAHDPWVSNPEVLIKAVIVLKLSYGEVARRYGVPKVAGPSAPPPLGLAAVSVPFCRSAKLSGVRSRKQVESLTVRDRATRRGRSRRLARDQWPLIRRIHEERMTGIEPALSAWEAEVLPLNYIRVRHPTPTEAGDDATEAILASVATLTACFSRIATSERNSIASASAWSHTNRR